MSTGHNQFESTKRGQKPYGMGHLEMTINIMGYQNCVSYKEEHEVKLGTSFCSLIALMHKTPRFCMIIYILIILIFLTTLMSLHTATAPAIRAAVKTVVSCQCSRLRFRILRLKTEETPVFCVCKQKQEFIAPETI